MYKPHVYVDFYLLLGMFNLLFHDLLLALSWSWCTVLLAEYITILIVFIEKVDSFLGFGFLLSS